MSKEAEKAGLYRSMMEQWAWKDFSEFLKRERELALEGAIVCSDIQDVQLQRGRVKCIDSIFSELNHIVSLK